MGNKLVKALGVCGILLVGGITYAGSSSSQVVSIWTDSAGLQNANGTLKATRDSADATQYIGCSRYAYDTGSNFVICYARSAAGAYQSCQTSDASMMRVAETLNPASYLYFVTNTDGTCDRVITVAASFDL